MQSIDSIETSPDAKHQFLINKQESTGLRHLNDSKASDAQQGGRGGRRGLSCSILKIGKKCPDFVKYALIVSIQTPRSFPARPFFLVFLTKCL